MIDSSGKTFDYANGILRLDCHSGVDACLSLLPKIESLESLNLVLLSPDAQIHIPSGMISELSRKLDKRGIPFIAESNRAFYCGLQTFKALNSVEAKQNQLARLHVFCAERATLELPSFKAPLHTRSSHEVLTTVAIVGAGTMGGGIAMCFASAGVKVILMDASEEGLEKGLQTIKKNYERSVIRGRITEEQYQQAFALITCNLDFEALSEADLLIEAVFEDMALKQTLFKRFDRYAKPGAILATNTSTFDINEIAQVTRRPEDVIGLHFFSPANIMPLLEVVRTTYSSEENINRAMSIARSIHKTPVLANICYGFIGNRMMEVYAREAEAMVLEGASPEFVDKALENFGMAMGILRVFDMAGVDVGVKAHQANAGRFPPDPGYYQASQALFDAGRLGQKSGAGFYLYHAGDRRAYEDKNAINIIRERAQSLGIKQRSDHTQEEVVERCLYPLMNEAFSILEEGVALKASDIDVVWTLGYGFPREQGGPLYYAETLGLAKLLVGMLKYQSKFGEMHWKISPLLLDLVEKGQSVNAWQAEKYENVSIHS